MINKNVCPNCGQLYDTSLEKCPLCGAAAQVLEAEPPVQRRRITEAERRQRRADRKEAEQEARLRRKNDQIVQDAEEERLLEEEAARRKEEKRLKKEAKRAAKQGREESGSEVPISQSTASPYARGAGGVAPVRTGSRPAIEEQYIRRDRTRVPRFFLVLSFLLLLATLVVGGSYLLWKLEKVKLPVYDKLFAKYHQSEAAADTAEQPAISTEPETTAPASVETGAEALPCRVLRIENPEITLTAANAIDQILVVTDPTPTSDNKLFVSADERIAKVSSVGEVTAVSPGTVVITVTCGSQTAECTVYCEFEGNPEDTQPAVTVDHLELNKDDMTFFNPGENYVLAVTNVPTGSPVTWRSLDEEIATVDENGHVYAVGNGTTKVIATLNGVSAECWVRCRFPAEEEGN